MERGRRGGRRLCAFRRRRRGCRCGFLIGTEWGMAKEVGVRSSFSLFEAVLLIRFCLERCLHCAPCSLVEASFVEEGNSRDEQRVYIPARSSMIVCTPSLGVICTWYGSAIGSRSQHHATCDDGERGRAMRVGGARERERVNFSLLAVLVALLRKIERPDQESAIDCV